MKRFLIALCLLAPVSCISLTGCTQVATANTPPAALAPGYISQADQQMKQVLDAAKAFYDHIQQDSASGKITLSQPEKDAFNILGTAINKAQPVYLAYHNGTGTLALAQLAVNEVTAKQSAVQAMGVK